MMLMRMHGRAVYCVLCVVCCVRRGYGLVVGCDSTMIVTGCERGTGMPCVWMMLMRMRGRGLVVCSCQLVWKRPRCGGWSRDRGGAASLVVTDDFGVRTEGSVGSRGRA
jgi:hypothetical protein